MFPDFYGHTRVALFRVGGGVHVLYWENTSTVPYDMIPHHACEDRIMG